MFTFKFVIFSYLLISAAAQSPIIKGAERAIKEGNKEDQQKSQNRLAGAVPNSAKYVDDTNKEAERATKEFEKNQQNYQDLFACSVPDSAYYLDDM